MNEREASGSVVNIRGLPTSHYQGAWVLVPAPLLMLSAHCCVFWEAAGDNLSARVAVTPPAGPRWSSKNLAFSLFLSVLLQAFGE